MTLHMVQIIPDSRRLMAWAKLHNLPSGDSDAGYMLHAALRTAFGPQAPKPFLFQERRDDKGRGEGKAILYGYTTADAEALKSHCQTFAEPMLAQAFPLEGLASKVMPAAFPAGHRLGFEVRICPVVRQDRGSRDRSREIDALLAAPNPEEDDPGRRETVYRAWLARELGREGAARLVDASMTVFQRSRVARRNVERSARAREKPDATFRGTLEVASPEGFAALLARGVGRHRAFGFGMLLLRAGP